MKTKTYNFLLCIVASVLTLLINSSSAATLSNNNASTSCNRTCGGISIPFPFGIGGKDCYLSEWYEVVCNTTTAESITSTVLFLSMINLEVVNVSLSDTDKPYGVVQIKVPVTSLGCSGNSSSIQGPKKWLPGLNVTGKGSPYFLTDNNRLVSVGCGTKVLMTDNESETLGCETARCDDSKRGEEVINSICNGYICCQARIPMERPQAIGVNIERSNGANGCRVAFLTSKSYTPSNATEAVQIHSNGYEVVELGWYFVTSDFHSRSPWGCVNLTLHSSYSSSNSCGCEYGYFSGMSYRNCFCNSGYTGNPYLRGGCKDTDACKVDSCGEDSTCINLPGGSYGCESKPEIPNKPAKPPVLQGILIGFSGLLFVVGILWLLKLVKRQRRIRRSKKFFKRNGGLLLKQQLTTKDGNVETSRIFSSKELNKATDNFSMNRVLGQGGQGTVYKGMLVDGKIVAVKRSKVVDEDKMEHCETLGCCLETEVPILVYEYIPNGDLFKRLHDETDDYTMTWEVRLRIAIEIAGALSYMHSASLFPIYHRDIKTTNILLDETYQAKVSDFGTSRSVTVDQTHLTTLVAGIFGYMDPEYFLSSQYTDKSDVYSFGVVLVELITGERPLHRDGSEEDRGLANHFLEAMKENRVAEMIATRIKNERKLDQVITVAKLARKCLNRKGKKRPNMKEVSHELEMIRSSSEDVEVQAENEDDQLVEITEEADS